MTTFSTIFLECPNCHNKMQAYETMSYHVHHSEAYSDGMVKNSPSTPYNKSILICSSCKKPFWRDDALMDHVSDEDNNNSLAQTMDVNELPFAFEDDFSGKLANYYLNLLDEGFATSVEKEIFLRVDIWQLMNDKIRYKTKGIFYNLKTFGLKYALKNIKDHKKRKIEFDKNIKQFNLNLKKLISIFKAEFAEQKLMLAEMYRESENFKMSISILEKTDCHKNPSAYKQILKASKRKRKEVFKIN